MTSKSGLDIVGLPNLIQSISNEAKTGTLKVQSDLGEKYIYFRKGGIQQVSSPQKPSILAEGLRRHPELDNESYQEICRQQRETGQSLASLILGEDGGQDMVIAVCQFLILEEICEIFTWQNCHCEFQEGPAQPMLFDMEIIDVDIALNTNMVLLEAARRYDEWKVILEIIPSKRDVPYIKQKIGSECSGEMIAVAQMIDGFRDIEEILSEVRLSPFAAMKALTDLLNAQLIEFRTGAELLQITKLDVFREDKHKSIKLYERAEEKGEKSNEITMWLAHSYEAMGMRNKAARQYRDLGYSYLAMESYDKAANAFEMVTRITPEDLDAQERLTTLLPRMNCLKEYGEKTITYARWLSLNGDRRRAIMLLKEATEKSPENLDGLDFLGSLYQEAGDRQNAIKTYRLLAKEKLQAQDAYGAIIAYQKITQLDPENLEDRKAMAEILRESGKYLEALEHYRIIGKKVAGNLSEDGKLAEYLAFAGERIIEREPDDLIARQWLAQAHIAQKKNDQAIRELEELLHKIEEKQKTDEKQNLPFLVDTLKSLVALKPNDFTNRMRLADAYLKIKREREAIQEYFNLGVAAADANNIPQALEAFEKLLSYEPSNYATRLKKAEILTKEQQNEQAIQELMLTGYLSMGADKLWQAVKAFRQVLTMDRESQVLCYLELGQVYEKLGKKKEAIASYKKHIQKSGKHFNFGDALKSCERILALEPNNQWAIGAKNKLLDCTPKMMQIFMQGTPLAKS